MNTHDFTTCFWGHNILAFSEIDNGHAKIIGVGPFKSRIKKGDFLTYKSKRGISRVVVISVKYDFDPPDYFTLEVDLVNEPVEVK